MATANMSLNEPTVGQTTGPAWATETNSNWESIDAHDHSSGKGVQLTPSSLNINADVEFNLNSATELKNVVLDNTVHSSGSGDTNVSLYVYDGNFYYRNASGIGVQITSGSGVNTSGGSIDNMTTNAQVNFSSNSYSFKFDKTLSDPGMAKMAFADIDLYKYNSSGSAAKVALKFLGSGTTAALTVPDETGTLLSTATSFAGTINIATSSSNAPINLKPNGTGHVAVGNGGASGKLTSNGAYDLVLDTNSGTNSGNITITDAADGNISLSPNGTGEIVIGSGSASGKITSSGAHDLVLDTNAGTNSGSITITDGTNGEITIDTHGTGDINLTAGADVNIPSGIGLTFGNDGEKIEGNGTKLDIAASELDFSIESGGDINIGTDIGLTFGNDGEKIEGNGTKLDIAAAELDFSIEAGGDINIGADIGLTFGNDGEKIEGDGTDLTIASSGILNLNTGSATGNDLRVNNSHFVVSGDSASCGIGTTDPWSLLDVRGTGDNANINTLTLQNDDYEANQTGQAITQLFRLNRAGTMRDAASIKVGKDSDWDDAANADSFLSFSTTLNDTITERMRINSSGNVGIGTDDIDTKLHIAGTDATTAGLMIENTNATANQRRLRIYSSAQKAYFDQPNDAYSSATDIMAFDLSNQNVGIGTTSPQSLLHVNGEMRDNRGVLAGLFLHYTSSLITNGNSTSITQINGYAGIIKVVAQHTTYIPFFTRGGAGVAYTITWLDPDSGFTTSDSFSYSESGSNANTYTVSMTSGGGVLYFEATSMPSNYTVYVYRWF